MDYVCHKVMFVLLMTFSTALATSDVQVFTDSNFQHEIAKHDLILVEFYAPWCGHCKKLAPEYEKAAIILLRAEIAVPLAKVDCTVEKQTCNKYGIEGYPGLKIFRNGEFVKDYDGERETHAIVQAMKKEAGSSTYVLDNVSVANNFLSRNSVGVVGFFNAPDSGEVNTFQKIAGQMSHLRFAYTTNVEVKSSLNQTEQAVVLYRPTILQNPFEESQLRTTEIDFNKLKTFLEANQHGLCAERNQANADSFKYPLVAAYFNVDYVRNAKGANYWRNRIMKVANKTKGQGHKVSFSISNIDEMSRELDECGIEDRGGEKPVICGWENHNKRFRMDDVFSIESFEKFVKDFLSGKVKRYIKSEPVPASNDDFVKVVVANTFEEIVNDKTKDVLIEFYAPWCGHCKTLAPKYEEVAKKLKKEKNIVIAKMDATANDVPTPYEVSGFPTIYFAPRFRKDSPRRYNGEREVKDIITYLASEATNELQGYDQKGNKRPKKKKNEDTKTEL